MSTLQRNKEHGIDVQIFPTAGEATQFAAQWLFAEFAQATPMNVMLAGGNTPLALYDQVGAAGKSLEQLTVFALDEYVGVPLEHPRNCANLIRSRAVYPWGIPVHQYHSVSSSELEAEGSIAEHESKIASAGGLDLVILGLGQNWHIGFNEPGSQATDRGRIVELKESSIEANRQWFDGAFAPGRGVTTGMSTILSARKILLLAFGRLKRQAVCAMLTQHPTSACPASFLQYHRHTVVVLDEPAAEQLTLSERPER